MKLITKSALWTIAITLLIDLQIEFLGRLSTETRLRRVQKKSDLNLNSASQALSRESSRKKHQRQRATFDFSIEHLKLLRKFLWLET